MNNRIKLPLWIRIYLSVFAFLTIVLVFISYQIVTVSNEHILESEYSRSLDKHRMFINALSIYASAIGEEFDQTPSLKNELLAQTIRNYVLYYTDQKTKISVTNEKGKKLFNNMSATDEIAMSLNPIKDGKRNFVLRTIDSRTVLFVSGWMEIGGHYYRLDLSTDLTELFKQQQTFALQISIWLSIGMCILALGLFFLIKKALHPLIQLSKQAQAIAAGKLDHRISIKQKDEVGQLADDFNHMADAIQTNMEQLKQNVKEKEAFISSLTHELKTPLTSIIGYSSLLLNFDMNERNSKHAIQAIHLESKRLDDLSKKLLDLFRIGNGQHVIKEKISISTLIQKLKTITKVFLAQRDHSLYVQAVEAEIEVDQELILVLINNLIENASRASDRGATIEIDVTQTTHDIIICVSDHGCGIPMEHLEQVFKPFFTINNDNSSVRSGYGFGLSLCKTIAESHHGRMYIESAIGKGTKVFTILPQPSFTKR